MSTPSRCPCCDAPRLSPAALHRHLGARHDVAAAPAPPLHVAPIAATAPARLAALRIVAELGEQPA